MRAPAFRCWLPAAVLAAALVFSSSATTGAGIPGEFHLKFSFAVDPGSWWHNGSGYLMTGIPSIDTLNVQYRVTDMIPLFYPLASDPDVRALEEQVGLDRIFKAIMDPALDPDTAAAAYDADGATEYAETNEETAGDGPHQYIPNDDLFGYQWSLDNTGQTGGAVDADIDGPEAWMIQRGDSSVVIAITDTGVNFDLPDLRLNTWVNPGEDLDNDRVVFDGDDINGVDDDGNGKIDDLIGWDCVQEDNGVKGDEHGSMVAHVLNAIMDNNSKIASAAGSCKTMIVRAGSGSGHGSFQADNCAQAIRYAASNGADVINMSWSWSSQKKVIKDACKFAYGMDCVLVASAGNSNWYSQRWPAAWEEADVDVIAVAGTNHSDRRYYSSNYGTWVDLSAPSENVFTVKTDGDTTSVDGTSFGAPIVSGIAALLRSAYSGLSADEVIDRIESTCDDIDALNPGYEGKLGAGRVNAYTALQLNLFGWTPDLELSTHGEELSSYNCDIAASGDTLHAVWSQTLSLPIGVPEVYYARSTDNGETWSAPVLLSNDDGVGSTDPAVAAENGEVYVVWSDDAWGANTDVSLRYSNDYGATFAAERNATYTYATASSEGPEIALADSVAHLVWVEHGASDTDCYYRALKGGARSGGLFTVSSPFVGTNAIRARVDAEGDYVQVVWEQNSGGNAQIVHRRNTSAGDSLSWNNRFTLAQGPINDVVRPDVSMAGRYVYVVWQEATAGHDEVMIRRNKCRGHPAGWGPAGAITPTDDGLSAREPRVAAEGEGVDIVYSSYNGFNFEIYNVYSKNHGGSYHSPERVTFNAGSSSAPALACLPGWASGQTNYLYLGWQDNSHSTTSTRIRFKRCEPRYIGLQGHVGSYNFDDHDLSGWGTGQSGGNTISITPGPSVSPPNALLMNSQSPGYAWAETPAQSLDLDSPHWLTTWLYLDGSTNDGVIVMDNQEVRLDIVSGVDLVAGTGDPIQSLTPYEWYLIECYATPSSGTYDVFVNEEFRATVPFEAGPPSPTILVGDVIDGPAGFGTVRWDDLGFEGVTTLDAGGPPPVGRPHAWLRVDAFPNPFRQGTTIAFTLPAGPDAGSAPEGGASQRVTLRVFDVCGRLVRALECRAAAGLPRHMWWDGKDESGGECASGAYLVHLSAGGAEGAAKVVLVR